MIRLPPSVSHLLSQNSFGRFLIVLGLFYSGLVAANAQAPPSNVPTIIPPSPTAAALEKYGQIPVSAYTGVPDISVPLYDIKVRDLHIPLRLSYHAGGFRVADEASWVGLGWSLQAGGVLTRTTKNLDDLLWFIPQNGHAPYSMPDCTPANDIAYNPYFSGDPYTGAMTAVHAGGGAYVGADITTYVRGIAAGQPYARDGVFTNTRVDWEPDDFRFTMGNYSGAFAFDQQGTIHLLDPQQRVKINYALGTTGRVLWNISTPDGFRYEFAAEEVSSTASPDPLRNSSISAWYLTRIISPLGEEATFSYETGANVYNQLAYSRTDIKESQATGQPVAPTISATYSAGGLNPQYLRRIDFKTGYVVFERDKLLRKDLRGGQRLSRVAVYTRENRLLKAYDLQASYFETPDNLPSGYLAESGSFSALDSAKAYDGKRLRLDAVIESGQDNVHKPPTRFTYNATPLPVKSSYSVDFWGFYNGRRNTGLIPTYAGPNLNNIYTVYPGANRSSVAGPMQACILQNITYPTGGKVTFSFEPHSYGNLTEEDDQLVEGTETFYMQADNVTPSPYYPVSKVIRVKAPTPLTLDYKLSIENGGDIEQKKARTTLQLIDSVTNKPFTSGSPSLGNYVIAQWSFLDGSPTPYSPYDPPNMTQVSGHAVILLPAGTYTLVGYTPNCTSSNIGGCHAIVYSRGSYPILQRLQYTSIHSLLAGGLRVKRIEESDNLNPARNQVQVYDYGTGGVLLNRPVFSRVVKYLSSGEGRFQHQLTSYSQAALSSGAKGSAVGYAQVSVLQGAQGEGGKTTYTYHCQPDASIRYQDRQPNVPSRSDELNGSLLRQDTYQHDDTGFHLISQVENTYESVLDTQYHYDVPAVFKGEVFTISSGTSGDVKGERLYYYSIPVNWVRLVSKTTRQFNPRDELQATVATTRYAYDTLQVGHMQVSQTRTTRSDGTTLLNLMTYPGDYTSVTSGPLAAMRSLDFYQPDAVVETSTLSYGPSETMADAKTVAGSYTTYSQPSSTSRFQPATISQLALAQPQAGLRPAAPTLPPIGRYTSPQHLLYEAATANLQQVRREHGLPTIYIWGYDNTLPVAKVENATLSQIQAALGVDVNTLLTDQQLRDVFQRVRQQLPQAHITSFTHQPLVGMTSQTDPSGRILFYEYDEFQRLLRTRDEQGRILSQQQYHYVGK